MAYLLDQATNTCFPLAPHHTFGRLASSVDTLVDKPYISKLHAAIEWTGAHWCLKSLGLNGTWINGSKLNQGDSRDLHIKDEIHLAEPRDPGFVVADLTPPGDMLWPLDHPQDQIKPIQLSRYHLLPDNNNPELALFQDESTQFWYCEALGQGQESHQRKINHGDLLEFCGSRWQFAQVHIYCPTEAKSSVQLNDFHFIFHLSQDEETTQLQLQLHQQQLLDLELRSHHYLLLQLARHRVLDAARGLDKESQGWIYAEQLAAELGLDATHINIQIFRARKQLADNLPNVLNQQSLVERRAGKIRFGCEQLTVYKAAKLILALPLPANN